MKLPFISNMIFDMNQLNQLLVVKKFGKIITRSRIWIKNEPKINKLLTNIAKLYTLFSASVKYSFEKTIQYSQYMWKQFVIYTNSFGIYITDFIIESPTSIIDLILYWNNLTKMELGRVICSLIMTMNTIRIIIFLKALPCDLFFCPNYIGGYRIQSKIIQRLYIQSILTNLVCWYFTVQSTKLRTFDIRINLTLYKQQALVYFLLIVLWYNLSYKIWFFKQNNNSNTQVFRVISIKKFKKILKYFYAERYNNEKYDKPHLNKEGNVKVLNAIKSITKKDLIISMRLLNTIENQSIEENNNWKKMNYRIYTKITKSLDKYAKKPNFTGIFIQMETKSQTEFFDTDFILSNWNLILSIVIFSLTVIEGLLEHYKNKNNKIAKNKQELSDNKN